MQKENFKEIEKQIVPILLKGGIGVLPTDTLYGLVGSVMKKKTVERIYALRQRDIAKPMIILISSVNDLKNFGISLNALQKKTLKSLWPGKVSVILECKNKKWEYLHRRKNSLAFRLPDDLDFQKMLKKSGPLVAPSANLEGKEPAATYLEALKYFGENVDFYVDFGRLKSKPSTIVSLDGKGEVEVLRSGAVKMK